MLAPDDPRYGDDALTADRHGAPRSGRSAEARALDVLEALLEAVTQSGPDAGDLDVDHDALVEVVHDAHVTLYEAGRLIP